MQYEEFQFILFDRQPDGVLLATLNRPEVMNATNARLHWELTKLWGVVDEDPSVKVVVVTGAGERAFSAGGDLEMVEAMVGNADAVAVVKKEASDIVYNMLACEKPIVSAINGIAVGAGLAVALLADVSIISEKARITDGHTRLGVAAGDHAAIVWPLMCGPAKAKYYLMTADFIEGKRSRAHWSGYVLSATRPGVAQGALRRSGPGPRQSKRNPCDEAVHQQLDAHGWADL